MFADGAKWVGHKLDASPKAGMLEQFRFELRIPGSTHGSRQQHPLLTVKDIKLTVIEIGQVKLWRLPEGVSANIWELAVPVTWALAEGNIHEKAMIVVDRDPDS